MIPSVKAFHIRQASSVVDAATAHKASAGASQFYAGGTELLLVMKQNITDIQELIDLKTIPDLNLIEVDHENSQVIIGALVTHRAVETSPIVQEYVPLLAEVEQNVANIRVRNVGTLGGNLCFAEPHSDIGLLATLLDATLLVESSSGERTVPASEFITGAYETCLQPGELLTEIRFPFQKPRTGTGYQRFQFHERPTVGVGVTLTLAEDLKHVAEAHVAVGCVGPVPVRVPRAEALLTGNTLDEAVSLGDQAGIIASESCEIIPDLTGSVEYKAHLVRVFVRRAIEQARERLSGRTA